MTINARRARRHAAEDALSAPDGLLDLDAAKQEPRQLDQQEYALQMPDMLKGGGITVASRCRKWGKE